MIPMSLRTTEGEKKYQDAKKAGTLIPLDQEKRIHEFRRWYVIENRFPYDGAYKVCNMLIPKRKVGERSKLRLLERRELRKIMEYYCNPVYDQVCENMSSNRSVKDIWHLHLLSFITRRKDTKL